MYSLDNTSLVFTSVDLIECKFYPPKQRGFKHGFKIRLLTRINIIDFRCKIIAEIHIC